MIDFMKFKMLLLAFAIGVLNLCAANIDSNVKFTVKAKQLKSDTIYLGYYYNGKPYVQDTIRLDKNGRGELSSKKELKEGAFIMYFHGTKYFDLLIGKDKNISVEIKDTLSLPESVVITGARESVDFHNYALKLKSSQQSYSKIGEQLKNTEDSLTKVNLQAQAKAIYESVNATRDSLIEANPGTMLSVFLNGIKTPEYVVDENIPDSLRPMHRYLFEKEHFLDNLDFADERTLRTSFLPSTIDNYLSTKLFQINDSIIPPVIKLVERSRKNNECFRVVLNHCMNYAINSKIMGMDNLMVELGRRYYLNGLTDWADSTWLKNLEEEIYKNERSLVGMKAANIQLADTENNYKRLYDIGGSEVTILYFYEPSCGHCRKTMPKVGEFAKKYASDPRIKVVAVYMLEDKEEWTKFIEEADLSALVNVWDPNRESYYWYYFNTSTTPMVYVMNKEHKIFAKKIDVDTLYLIAENELK
ncbi:MAG: TlpA disulfide reductase family protein [Paludibacteraceae bacterium]|nr:TlpA disulfide reductase family protein [Paludibacteraceae bacterium]